MSVAFLFPGQGSQRAGMLHALPDHPAVAQTLHDASAHMNLDVMELDSELALLSTYNAQVCLFIAGVAVARALTAEGIVASAVAGLSVGAFAAAVICGALSFADGLCLVRQRATLMEMSFPQGYGLAVVVGLSEQQVSRLTAQVHSEEAPVFVGNINAPRQITVAGADAAILRVLDAARKQGARKAEKLPVAVPSHCPLLQPVAGALRDTLRGMQLQTPVIPYIGNVRARALRTGTAIADDLATAIAHGVRWHDTIGVLIELGCDLFVETHPGHVLRDLVSESFPDVRAVSTGTSSVGYVRRLVAQNSW